MREQLAKMPSDLTASPVPADHGCWSDRELCEIDRIAACAKSALLELEGGESDEGDPWCILHDPGRKQVIMHIARIDRRYIVVCPSQSQIHRTPCLAGAVETALRELKRARIGHGKVSLV